MTIMIMMMTTAVTPMYKAILGFLEAPKNGRNVRQFKNIRRDKPYFTLRTSFFNLDQSNFSQIFLANFQANFSLRFDSNMLLRRDLHVTYP